MKEKSITRCRPERGQVLVIVALVFVGLLAVAGLTIDGGNVYVQRRQAQNAADAAALAGTRMVTEAMQTCDDLDLIEYDLDIARTINSYAQQNGIPDTNEDPNDEINDNVMGFYVDMDLNILGTVGLEGTLPLGTAGIRVEVNASHETFFMPVIGVDTIPSTAAATALTGRARQMPAGAPLLPIAVPEVVVRTLDPGTDWEVHDNLDGEFCYTPEGGGEQVCINDPGAPQNAQRGWLNLNHIFNQEYLGSSDRLNRTFEQSPSADKCPADPLKKLSGLPGYASGECPYPHPIIAGPEIASPDPALLDPDSVSYGDFIHGSSGAMASGTKAVYDGYAGQTALAPVFDYAFLRDAMVDTFDPQADCPDGYSNGGGFSSAGGGSGDAYYYHIIGYTAFTVGTTPDNHVVTGSFEKVLVAAGFLPDGYDGGRCTNLVYGIALWD